MKLGRNGMRTWLPAKEPNCRLEREDSDHLRSSEISLCTFRLIDAGEGA